MDAAIEGRHIVARSHIVMRERLSDLAAAHRLGGFVNAVDELAKTDPSHVPYAAWRAADAIGRLLDSLDDGQPPAASPRKAETWRDADPWTGAGQ